MKLSFYGAVREVTGSSHFLQAAGRNILIDCGMEQSSDVKTPVSFPVPPKNIDYVFLTHAHIDHSGRLPLLYREGFRGKIYSTDSTYDLCEIMLRDAAHIQEFEAEWENRKGKRAGREPVPPYYEMADAEAVLKLFEACAYGRELAVCEGIKIRFTDVGHLLGSACIEVWATEDEITKKIVFSGDVGNTEQPLIKDPSFVDEADYVVVESTYGNRVHNPPPDYAEALASIFQKTFDRGGNVVIPSFAVGRTQEVLYFIRQIKERKMVKKHDHFPVYVDSPLAVEATNIYTQNRQDYDDEALALLKKHKNPIGFNDLKLSVTGDDSRLINFDDEPKVIISASGMCDAGRIKHHLKHNLWRRESTVVFVGYQANGTLGRIILDGARRVRIMGEDIKIEAEIVRLEGLSAHADKYGLMAWLDAFGGTPQRIFVVHGSEEASVSFAEEISARYKSEITVPYYGEGYDLAADVKTDEKIEMPFVQKGSDAERESPAYTHLLSVANKLTEVIMRQKGQPSKKLSKLSGQLEAIIAKWSR